MSVYVGLGNSSKEISGIYLGGKNSVKEVSEGYIADADGNVKEIYSSVEPGQQVFTTSGTFTVPKGVKKVDVFLVGGGGKGGGWQGSSVTGEYTCQWSYYYGYSGNGGGGGYTKTIREVSVTPGNKYPIVVGAGSVSCSGIDDYETNGGSSTAFGYEAIGGYNGRNRLSPENLSTYNNYLSDYMKDIIKNDKNSDSGKGGSGGGEGARIWVSWWSTYYLGTPSYHPTYSNNGGYDGSNGYARSSKSGEGTSLSNVTVGQGTTTRAFGESSGTLYSGGGGGAPLRLQSYWWTSDAGSGYIGGEGMSAGYAGVGGAGGGSNGTINSSVNIPGTDGTGGGGGGNAYLSSLTRRYSVKVPDGDNSGWYRRCVYDYNNDTGHNGGSGIVIIRWGY